MSTGKLVNYYYQLTLVLETRIGKGDTVMEYESDVSGDDAIPIDPERDPSTFYLEGKLASELPQDDTQPSAALYRTVCGGDVAAVNFLLQNGHDPNVPYYYIPKKKLASHFKHDVGESIEDERGMFHYPLHRAVLQDNVELVELLLTSPPAESINFGLKVRSPPTLRIGVWAYTGPEDCLNVSLKAEINILFICL